MQQIYKVAELPLVCSLSLTTLFAFMQMQHIDFIELSVKMYQQKDEVWTKQKGKLNEGMRGLSGYVALLFIVFRYARYILVIPNSET